MLRSVVRCLMLAVLLAAAAAAASPQPAQTGTISGTMQVGALTNTVQVTGDTPIVDMTNTTANTRVRRDEFEKIPVGRSYQSLIGTVPGVVGTGNVNAMGALTSNNLFIIDSVDTTDPTTGTFGTNLNYEPIQEVSVYTSAAFPPYGGRQRAGGKRNLQAQPNNVRD